MDTLMLGDFHRFTVVEVRDKEYVIEKDGTRLILPFSQATKKLQQGDDIDAFLYVNPKKQIAPTMKRPYATPTEAALLEVVEAKHGLGVFVKVGLDKDMLVSKDDLPVLKKLWPQTGDKLFCTLKPGHNQIVARPVSRFRMRDHFYPDHTLEKGVTVEVYVFYHSDEGVVTYTKEGHELFIYEKHMRETPRLGEKLEARVTVMRDDLHYNASVIEQKETMLESDAEKLLAVIKEAGGSIPYGDKSSPDAVFERFHMSKAAFKRAIGSLYKAGLVTPAPKETRLKKND